MLASHSQNIHAADHIAWGCLPTRPTAIEVPVLVPLPAYGTRLRVLSKLNPSCIFSGTTTFWRRMGIHPMAYAHCIVIRIGNRPTASGAFCHAALFRNLHVFHQRIAQGTDKRASNRRIPKGQSHDIPSGVQRPTSITIKQPTHKMWSLYRRQNGVVQRGRFAGCQTKDSDQFLKEPHRVDLYRCAAFFLPDPQTVSKESIDTVQDINITTGDDKTRSFLTQRAITIDQSQQPTLFWRQWEKRPIGGHGCLSTTAVNLALGPCTSKPSIFQSTSNSTLRDSQDFSDLARGIAPVKQGSEVMTVTQRWCHTSKYDTYGTGLLEKIPFQGSMRHLAYFYRAIAHTVSLALRACRNNTKCAEAREAKPLYPKAQALRLYGLEL
jgi:hypothetical protein